MRTLPLLSTQSVSTQSAFSRASSQARYTPWSRSLMDANRAAECGGARRHWRQTCDRGAPTWLFPRQRRNDKITASSVTMVGQNRVLFGDSRDRGAHLDRLATTSADRSRPSTAPYRASAFRFALTCGSAKLAALARRCSRSSQLLLTDRTARGFSRVSSSSSVSWRITRRSPSRNAYSTVSRPISISSNWPR